MFRDPQQMRRRLMEIVEKFRQKGATSPEKALTLQELDLPPRFEQAMHRRLGQTGIFIEVNGKYYLNEDRLRQIQEQRGQQEGGSGGFGGRNGNLGGRVGPPSSHRYVGVILMLPVGLIVAFVLIYVVGFGQGYFPGELLVILLVVALFMMAARLLFRRSRRQYWRGQGF